MLTITYYRAREPQTGSYKTKIVLARATMISWLKEFAKYSDFKFAAIYLSSAITTFKWEASVIFSLLCIAKMLAVYANEWF